MKKMKNFFLIFTILFSASVLADCCNFEFETSDGQVKTIASEHQDDDCGDSSEHSETQHCHCSPVNHLKIISANRINLNAPYSIQLELIPSSHFLLTSNFENLIFHPPIA